MGMSWLAAAHPIPIMEKRELVDGFVKATLAPPERARRRSRASRRGPGELLPRGVDADAPARHPAHRRRLPDAAGAPDQARGRDRDHRGSVRDRRRRYPARARGEPRQPARERDRGRRDADPLLTWAARWRT
jgi:hypothetical protein